MCFLVAHLCDLLGNDAKSDTFCIITIYCYLYFPNLILLPIMTESNFMNFAVEES